MLGGAVERVAYFADPTPECTLKLCIEPAGAYPAMNVYFTDFEHFKRWTKSGEWEGKFSDQLPDRFDPALEEDVLLSPDTTPSPITPPAPRTRAAKTPPEYLIETSVAVELDPTQPEITAWYRVAGVDAFPTPADALACIALMTTPGTYRVIRVAKTATLAPPTALALTVK